MTLPPCPDCGCTDNEDLSLPEDMEQWCNDCGRVVKEAR